MLNRSVNQVANGRRLAARRVVMNALASADMAMAGVRMYVTLDEAIDAMKRVGDALPAGLRETGQGGIAVCPSALRLKEKYIDGTV